MASFSTTELNATIDEKWDLEVEEARYGAAVILPRMNNRSALVKESGATIHISVKAKYTAGAVGANGAFVPQVYTVATTPVTLNQYFQVAAETEDRAKAASFWDPESSFPKEAGAAMGEQIDGILAGQYTGFTTNIIGDAANPAAFDDVPMRAAMLKLADLNVPKNELSFILPPIAFYLGLFAQDRFTSANTMGLPKNVLTTNFRFPLLGVPAYESTLLKTSGTAIKGFLLHKEAIAIAMQLNNTIKRAERTSALVFSSVVAIESLYGVAIPRENHGCVINIRNT